MAVPFQLVINCAEPDPLAHFWAAALGYVIEPPPEGFDSWDEYRLYLGLPEEHLGHGADCIVDPAGRAPRIWFQVSPDRKSIPNRMHIDIRASGEKTDPIETRKQRVDAEARRLAGLGAVILSDMELEEGMDHYAVAMKDPEGNEFDIN